GADADVGVGLGESEMLQKGQQQQRLHSVERKALPHFGEEADGQALGMAEQFVGSVRGGHTGSGQKAQLTRSGRTGAKLTACAGVPKMMRSGERDGRDAKPGYVALAAEHRRFR